MHVGYNPAIKATLKKELDTLLSGKDLPREPSPGEAAAQTKDDGVEKAWSVVGAYTGSRTRRRVSPSTPSRVKAVAM